MNTTNLIQLLAATTLASLVACAPAHDHAAEEAHEAEDESWAVTAWGEHFEIFAEADPLEEGATSLAFTHVTAHTDFSPLVEGTVSVVLVDSGGTEVSFSKDEPTRPGIFSIDVVPEKAGEFDLVFRVETPNRREDIPAGRVRVGARLIRWTGRAGTCDGRGRSGGERHGDFISQRAAVANGVCNFLGSRWGTQ